MASSLSRTEALARISEIGRLSPADAVELVYRATRESAQVISDAISSSGLMNPGLAEVLANVEASRGDY